MVNKETYEQEMEESAMRGFGCMKLSKEQFRYKLLDRQRKLRKQIDEYSADRNTYYKHKNKPNNWR